MISPRATGRAAVVEFLVAPTQTSTARPRAVRLDICVLGREGVAEVARLLTCLMVASVAHPVMQVVRAGSPAEIAQVVVVLVVIPVAGLHPFWAGAHEREQDKSVDTSRGPSAVLGEIDLEVPRSVWARCQNLASPLLDDAITSSDGAVDAAHPSTVRDLVAAFIVRYRKPFFLDEHVANPLSVRVQTTL